MAYCYSTRSFDTLKRQNTRQPRRQPTHYVYIEIPAQVKRGLQRVQVNIQDDARLLDLRPMGMARIHLTLGVFDLSREMSSYSANDVNCMTKNLLENVMSQVPEFEVRLGGLGHFSGRVIYLSVNRSSQLLKLRDYVVDEFEKRAIPCTDKRPYNPHITLFKGDFGFQRNLHHTDNLGHSLSRIIIPNFQSIPVSRLRIGMITQR